ncbi:hypothetical protein Ancab_034615 [Ancistrocladus abbreviatus]
MEFSLLLSFPPDLSLTDLTPRILSSLAFCALLGLLLILYENSSWLKSQRQRRKLTSQGIKGPPPSLLYGNVPEMQRIQSTVEKAPSFNGEIVAHDYTSTVFPYFEQWRKQYGPVYTYSTGNRQHLYVNDAEMVREISQNMSLDLGKPSYVTKALAPMLGNGILRSNRLIWAQHRKLLAPQFFMDKVKGMVGLMIEAVQPLLTKWGGCIGEAEAGGKKAAEIRVDEDLRTFSADVISRACFGSSFSKGEHIFQKLRTLQKLISKQDYLFKLTNFRLRRSKSQKEIKRLEKEIERLIWEVVEERRVADCSTDQKDLLQSILDGAIHDDQGGLGNHNQQYSKRFIVDNCKNIYFAGHESTAVAASWCLMLLALNPDWQDRIRSEVEAAQPCSHDDADSFLRIKSVTMVIQEALRLYPPAALISREALEDIEIGDLVVPKGVCVWTLIPTLHRDPDIWGPDANQFKPERFVNGVSNACKVPQAYLPFGVGGRLCLGRNFAMFELKLVLCLIVSKFNFSLSPKYRHAPAHRMIVEPGNGVHILIRKNN